MFDNIGLQINNVTERDFVQITKRMGEEKIINAHKIKFMWESLYVSYFPNEKKLTLKNSIHKFFNGALGTGEIGFNNYNDFDRYSMFTTAIYITEIFERPVADFQIFSKFEYGLNISTGVARPIDIINRYKSCIRNAVNEFYTMPPNSGKPFCRSCFFSDYRVKAYDKGRQAKFTASNLLRYEIALQGIVMVKRVLKMREVSLLDLILPTTWELLFGHMMEIYDSILKIPFGVKCSPEEIMAVYRYSDSLINADFKSILNASNYKAMRRSDRAVYDRLNSNMENVHNVIRQDMINKFGVLKAGDAEFSILN